MPELPEVETIRRQLQPCVEGREIETVEILDPRWSSPLAPAELEAALRGRRVERLWRRGKYLLWSLSGDVHLAQHLRMTGAVLVDADPEPSHTRVRMSLGPAGEKAAGGGGERATSAPGRRAGRRAARPGAAAGRDSRVGLVIVDPRRFGTGQLLLGAPALEEFLAARLGPEPFDDDFTAEHLRALARGRRAAIKALLLDQRYIAGVGNIYADEALFRAGIHPLRPAGRLTAAQHERLRETVIEALIAGIEARGASIDDFRHIDGVRGSFQDRFMVHLREGEPCPVCGGEIVKLVAAGRGTYVCETCQPRPRARPSRVRPPRAPAGARSPRRRAPR